MLIIEGIIMMRNGNDMFAQLGSIVGMVSICGLQVPVMIMQRQMVRMFAVDQLERKNTRGRAKCAMFFFSPHLLMF